MHDERRDTLLIILGAGASYDCLPPGCDDSVPLTIGDLPTLPMAQARPPLTQQLASARPLTNWLLDRWPSAAPVIDDLRRRLDDRDNADLALTLERALANYPQVQAEVIPEVKRHMLAVRFYLRDLLWAVTDYMTAPQLTGGITNHLTLLRAAMAWRSRGHRDVVFVSFNYDLLLEHAIGRWSTFNLTDITSYLADPLLSVLKPHGSVQWHWTSEHREYSSSLHEHGLKSIELAMSEANLEDMELRCLSPPPHSPHSTSLSNRRFHVPALALPVDDKSEFIWPDEQANRFRALQGSVSRLLTVGWRAMEPHFLDLLQPVLRNDAKVVVTAGGRNGPDEADEAQDRLQAATHRNSTAARVRPENWRIYGDGFTDLLRNSKELRWLLEDDS